MVADLSRNSVACDTGNTQHFRCVQHDFSCRFTAQDAAHLVAMVYKEKYHYLELGWTMEDKESIDALWETPDEPSGSRVVLAAVTG